MPDHNLEDLLNGLVKNIKYLFDRVKHLEELEDSGGGGGPLALDDLTDVNVPAPNDGDALIYDDVAGEWIAAPAGAGGHIIQDEGIPLAAEAALNFIGAGVTAADNPVTGATDVTIPAPAANNIKMVTFEVQGQLAVAAGALRLYNTLGDTYTIEEVEIAVGTAPTGAAIIVDVNIDGATIFTNPAHRPQIAAGNYHGNTLLIDIDDWDDGEYMTIDIDQIGAILPGANLTVMIRTRYT